MKIQEAIKLAKHGKSFMVSKSIGLAYFFENDLIHCFSYSPNYWERPASYDIDNENAFMYRELFASDWTLHKDIYITNRIKESRIERQKEDSSNKFSKKRKKRESLSTFMRGE